MTIRTRLTLWYALIFSGSLLGIGVAMYSELVLEARARIAHHPNAAVDDDAGVDITQIILIYGGTAIAVGLLGGWWLTRRAFAPVSALTAAAEKLNEGNLKQALSRTGNGDELDRLTEVFNAMTARLDDSFNRIREFSLHASHELKTPLTILCGETETGLRDDSLTPAQRERATSQLDELHRLARIVDGLTLLAKADAGQIGLKLEPLRLDELVRDNFEDAKILAEPHGIQVELTHCEEISVRGDRHRLRQLLLNLADNAIKHNQPKGGVTMGLRRVHDAVIFTIVNTGPGIPAESLPRVFDRFYRGDAAPGGAPDGCGLGLSIAQWIISAHGGTIQIASEPFKQTIVSVQIPVSAPEPKSA